MVTKSMMYFRIATVYERERFKVRRNNKQLRGKTPMVGETSTDCCLSNEAQFTIKNGYKSITLLISLSLTAFHVPPIRE